MSDRERADLAVMVSYLPELKALRDFVDRLEQLFEEGQSERTAWRRHAALVADDSFLSVPELASAVAALAAEKFANMIAFLRSPVCRRVRTNNHVERVNRKLRYEEKARYKWRRLKTPLDSARAGCDCLERRTLYPAKQEGDDDGEEEASEPELSLRHDALRSAP